MIYAAKSEPDDPGGCRYRTNTPTLGLDEFISNFPAPNAPLSPAAAGAVVVGFRYHKVSDEVP